MRRSVFYAQKSYRLPIFPMEVNTPPGDALSAMRKRRSDGFTGKASAVPAISAATQGTRLRERVCRAPSRRVRSAPAAGLFRRVAVGIGGGNFRVRSTRGAHGGPTRGGRRSGPKRRRLSGRRRSGRSRHRPWRESDAGAAAAEGRKRGRKPASGGYGRSLVWIDRCSAAPVSAKVPMPPERPTCPVVIARSFNRLQRRRV